VAIKLNLEGQISFWWFWRGIADTFDQVLGEKLLVLIFGVEQTILVSAVRHMLSSPGA
jgi:hypothetical protein